MEKDLRTITHVDWIDFLKVIATLLVIIGHCTYYNIQSPYGGINLLDNNCGASLSSKLINYLIGFIYTFHMPLFMAISGMCFFLSQQKRKQSFPYLVKSKWKRLLIPFLGVSIFYSIPLKWLSGYWNNSADTLHDILFGQLFLLGNTHLWYVFSLFWIFIIFYFIEFFNLLQHKWIWGLLLLISWLGRHMEALGMLFLGFAPAMEHLFYFSVGFIIGRINKGNTRSARFHFIFLLILFLFYVIFTKCQPLFPQVTNIAKYPVISLLTLMGGGNILGLSQILSNKMKSYKLTNLLKNNTYELYLYSDPLNYVLIACLPYFVSECFLESNVTAIFLFLIRFIFTATGALLVALLLKRIFKRK